MVRFPVWHRRPDRGASFASPAAFAPDEQTGLGRKDRRAVGSVVGEVFDLDECTRALVVDPAEAGYGADPALRWDRPFNRNGLLGVDKLLPVDISQSLP